MIRGEGPVGEDRRIPNHIKREPVVERTDRVVPFDGKVGATARYPIRSLPHREVSRVSLTKIGAFLLAMYHANEHLTGSAIPKCGRKAVRQSIPIGTQLQAVSRTTPSVGDGRAWLKGSVAKVSKITLKRRAVLNRDLSPVFFNKNIKKRKRKFQMKELSKPQYLLSLLIKRIKLIFFLATQASI